ncbi:MAG: hypothetical protein ACRDWX_09050, partial [Acidimicrobiia bacterium]
VGLVGMEPDPATARSIGNWCTMPSGQSQAWVSSSSSAEAGGGLPAGLAVGVGMTASVDEGLNYFLGLTAPPTAWPWQARVPSQSRK